MSMKKLIMLMVALLFISQLYPQTTKSTSSTGASIQYNQSTKTFELQNPPELKPFSEKMEPPFWGIYFWEFGDGHYSTEKKPVYSYKKAGEYHPSLRITAFKALNKPVTVDHSGPLKIFSGQSGFYPDYKLGDMRVQIATNAQDNVIPENEIRIALHYKAPANIANTQGYLFFFMNDEEEFDKNYEPFFFAPDDAPKAYHQEKVLSDMEIDVIVQEKLDGLAKSKALELLNRYQTCLSFFIEAPLKQNEERRVFFTIIGDKRLKENKETNRELTFTALWVPKFGTFNPNKDLATHKMQILAVHDPNRIRVYPRTAYFRKGYPKDLTYRIDFQNEEAGTVEDVEITFPIGEGMAIVNPRNLRDLVIKTDPPCEYCPLHVPEDLACFQVAYSGVPLNDSLVFTFKKIGLVGRKSLKFFESKKSTKGQVIFKLQSSGYASTPSTRSRAYIKFRGTPDERTRNARVAWRHRSLGLRLGLNVSQQGEEFESLSDHILDRLSIGLRLEDAAIGMGPILALEIGYSPFQMEKITTEAIDGNNVLPNGGFLVQRQNLDVKFIEVKALGGYQLNRFLRFQGGLGVQMPAFSDVTFEASAYHSMDAEPVLHDLQTIHSGLFDKRSSIYLFDNWFPPRTQAGVTFHLGAEVGLMNNLVVGVNNESRMYRHYYEHHCLFINNWQLYTRMKLFPIGMKRR